MYKVRGIVLSKETRAPVPHVQVVLYELDTTSRTVWTGSPPKLPSLENEPFPGDRIGSVLTSASGAFEFAFDPEAFRSANDQDKPDLGLLVLAPEDSCAAESPHALPLRQRLLHYSRDPIINAGTHEEYIIRLPEARLAELRLGTEVVTPRVPLAESAAHVARTQALRDVWRTAKRTNLRDAVKPALALKKRASEAFKEFSLSTLPSSLRSSARYLNPREAIAPKQRQLVQDALSQIRSADKQAGVRRRLRLRLPEASIRQLGLSIGKDGAVSGEASAHAVIREARSATRASLEFIDPIALACKELEATRRFRERLVSCGRSEPAPAPPSHGAHEALGSEALVREQVDRLTRHVTAPEEQLRYGVERHGEISATITRPSPTDVTSYHDFHEVQIAFDTIWKEAFDGRLPTIVQEAYAEMVRYANQVSGVPEEAIERINQPIESIQDMHRLYEEIQLLRHVIENQREDVPAAASGVVEPVPAPVVALVPGITDDEWSQLETSEQERLATMAGELGQKQTDKDIATAAAAPSLGLSLLALPDIDARIHELRTEADGIKQAARARREAARRAAEARPATSRPVASTRLEQLMRELDQRLGERYKFDVFAPGSMNYGLLFTYRQAWTPRTYQVGDLISTLPLAPKEVRRYEKKRIVKKSRSLKQLEETQSSRKVDTESTSRSESEIVKRAMEKTSFEQTVQGSLSIGVFGAQFGTRFGMESEQASSNTRRNFREAVVKAAEEYKQTHRIEVETATTDERQTTESGEISNPNEEITVTYLFYELQRQYEISERIHRLTPVILVANEVPEPHEIDEDWLIANHWILRRVILDEHYLPALDYVTTSIVGDEMAVEVVWTNLQRQARLVDELIDQVRNKQTLASGAFDELKRLTGLLREKSDLDKLKDINLAAAFGPFALFGLMGGDDGSAEKREEIAKLAIERADKDVQETSARLSREVTALQGAIDKYTALLREHLDRQAAIAALRIHVKDNIACYMQAIWDHECADQRYFRLYNTEVPWIEMNENTLRVSPGAIPRSPFSGMPGLSIEIELDLSYASITTRKLHEIAELDRPLGYKGNYTMYAVKEPNYLHWYMMQDYIDPVTKGVRDPEEAANYRAEELLALACCLKKNGVADDDPRLTKIHELLTMHMTSPTASSQLIVVPTDSLYIEALPGKHPVLEDFKLVHRAIDVKKAQAEVRAAEGANLRMFSKLLEGEREYPADKRIVIEGGDVVVHPET